MATVRAHTDSQGGPAAGSAPPPVTRVFGIGNPWRRDDAAGPVTAHFLGEMGIPKVDVREVSDGGASVINSWQPHDRVFLIDAAVSGAPPGTIHRLDAKDNPIPSDVFPCSTHDLGAAEVAEFARVLGKLPAALVVYGVEGANFEQGEGMSAEVELACRKAAEEIRREIEGFS
jgi:hydrogenase maturation protease